MDTDSLYSGFFRGLILQVLGAVMISFWHTLLFLGNIYLWGFIIIYFLSILFVFRNFSGLEKYLREYSGENKKTDKFFIKLIGSLILSVVIAIIWPLYLRNPKKFVVTTFSKISDQEFEKAKNQAAIELASNQPRE